MARYVTGITVVTGWHGSEPVGMTANSFISVSAEPPMVAFCPARSSQTWPWIASSGRFLVNVLSQSQDDVARRFAERRTDRFSNVRWAPSEAGPSLEDAVAVLHCELEQQLPAGDHVIVVAAVSSIGPLTSRSPLVFFRGAFARLQADGFTGSAAPAVSTSR